jgi:predicted O-methyltransferase YrrM
MKTEVYSSELLKTVEEALTEHKAFGDSAYILEQLEVTFKRRLGWISDDLPIAGFLLNALEQADDYTRYRIVGNTVIRCAVQHAHIQLEGKVLYGLPMADCEKIFETTHKYLTSGGLGSPFENGPVKLKRLGSTPNHGWIWQENYPTDVFGEAFRFILNQEYGESLCTPSAEEVAVLVKGEELLQELLPSLATSALKHAHLVGCFPDTGFWKGKVSSSQIRMGGIIFLNRHLLVNPWCVAEHLLHESLHQKLYDFRHGHSLLNSEYSAVDSPKVCSLWNADEFSKANHWDTHRTFAAFHVYVQLALLAIIAEEKASALEDKYGPFRGMVQSRKALERAQYLGEKLKEICWNELGEAGKRLRDWLMAVLDILNPTPPPKGAFVHLVLDLYQREANKVETVLKESEAARLSLPQVLKPIVREEVESTRRVLSVIGASQELTNFESQIGQYKDDELGVNFPAVRRMIVKTILGASPDGYGLSSRAPADNPDELVRQMVERGSERLFLLQTNVAPVVAAAKRRAKDLRFTMSCEDRVGQLLAVLAAAVPVGGRILEIGTGVGVGLAWIVNGLGDREDVKVISIESDRRLGNAAIGWSWPTYVEILLEDASTRMATLGAFNLIFADAAPIKYRQSVDLTVRLLKPGGMLIIDDLHAGPKTTEQQQIEKAALRTAIVDHPELEVVELDWASGLLLGTKQFNQSVKKRAESVMTVSA